MNNITIILKEAEMLKISLDVIYHCLFLYLFLSREQGSVS